MSQDTAKPTGRPSIRHPELDGRIVNLLNEGKPFRWFDSEEARGQGLPSATTIRRWRQEDEAFDSVCVRACEASAEADYDRMEELEEKALLPATDAARLDPYAVNVVLGNMRWRMERRKPRGFGKKVEVKGQVTLEQIVAAAFTPDDPDQ